MGISSRSLGCSKEIIGGLAIMAIEDSDGILNAAGYWTVGVAKGLAFVAVPVFAFSLMAGFALKIVKAGTRMGGA